VLRADFTLDQVELVCTADVAGIVAVPSLLLADRARISESAQILVPLFSINRSKTGKNSPVMTVIINYFNLIRVF
jgi:hypothetical protein